MSVLVLSKGSVSESSYKPFELREVHNYSGSCYVGAPSKIKTADPSKQAVPAKSREQHTSTSYQFDGSIPQLCLRRSASHPPTHRGILKNKSGAIEKSNIRKQVSFADLMGKVLTQVKEVPKLSEFEQRVEEDFNSLYPFSTEIPKQSISPVPTLKRVVKKNQWSYAKQDCMEGMRNNMVSLQEIILEGSTFRGKIRVVNISYMKSVMVRWTKDSWKTSFNATATYHEERGNVNHSSDCFLFYLPCESGCIEFAIQYITNGREYWDNNDSRNYQIRISQA
ncbi:Protein phosphatase 1 regulatory subunit 3E [Oopsacas minuta]|uniref:Protein phosphatase 1 regulatory subunit 3E n=1 Tax=Oopsacas minuta TaxID=111878 RepID=A0AAV7K1P0_9METZ|nr:Protein phosphatase 1 regulatory subunit 3E [Oopsacas minuta]